jgi:hypothetical protein
MNWMHEDDRKFKKNILGAWQILGTQLAWHSATLKWPVTPEYNGK